MHLNYYFLTFLSHELGTKLKGYKLLSINYAHREEVFLTFKKNDDYVIIKYTNYTDFTCLSFPQDLFKNKKATHHIFKPVFDQSVKTCVQNENDRSFYIEFENNFQLLFKLHGNRSNLILFQNGIPLEIHNYKLKNDSLYPLDYYNKPREISLAAFKEAKGNLQAIFPALDKSIINKYLPENFARENLETKWELITALIKEFKKGIFYLTDTNKHIALELIQHNGFIFKTTSALEASTQFEILTSKVFHFEKLRNNLLERLLQEQSKINKQIDSLQVKWHTLQEQTPFNQIADTIMANLENIPANSSTATLPNIHTNLPITFKLNRQVNAAKNAETYYKKGKNKRIEFNQIEETLQNKKNKLEALAQELDLISKLKTIKELNQFQKNNDSTVEKSGKPTKEHLFKIFNHDGFEIIVGKNAKNNDLLLRNFSHKEDLWLHARDVSGSHVLIKFKAGKNFPKSVIEKAAQLAAFYSKRKNDSLSPVIVTKRKYVRKPKNAKEGEVFVEREEVILVTPASFENN